MKHFLRLGMVAFFLNNSGNVYGRTALGKTCPEKFIATVTNVVDVDEGTYPKVEVDFQVLQTLKGASASVKKIQIVKDGPIQFKSGQTYTVEFRDNWLCSADLFTKI